MKRFYCVQWCHREKGWLDLPSLASTKEKEALDGMKNFGEQHPGVALRVMRKPHGWEPPGLHGIRGNLVDHYIIDEIKDMK